MGITAAQERRLDRLRRLAGRGLDLEAFWRAATPELAALAPFAWAPCWFTLDPVSYVVTSHFNVEIDELDPAVFQNEYVDDDVNKMADLAAAGAEVATLARATGGDTSRSPRARDLLSPYGLGHELIAVLRCDGVVWGSVTLYREAGAADFSDDELELVRRAGPWLAAGARRGLVLGEAADADGAGPERREGPPAAAVVVVGEDLTVVSQTPTAAHWLTALGGRPERLPTSVTALAAATADAVASGADLPSTRARTRDGRWARLSGTTLGGQVAVMIEPARPDHLGPLLMAAYGLTEREQAITGEVLRGASTNDIAEALFLSPYTVQDHLKSIFDKTGVRTRRQLLARVFFDHFEPRVRDNEGRVRSGRMMRGGPLSAVRTAPGGADG